MRALTFENIINRKPIDSRLTPISFEPYHRKKNGKAQRGVKCICSCGNECIITVDMFVRGITRSCGCLFIDTLLSHNTKYHPIVPKLHKQYKHMIQRCYNPNNGAYKYYGGRGVSVCDQWRNSYQAFLDWALENGWKDGLQMDKDKKADGSLTYGPNTVSFLTSKENNQYRRRKGSCL